jgi:hypothetical protein
MPGIGTRSNRAGKVKVVVLLFIFIFICLSRVEDEDEDEEKDEEGLHRPPWQSGPAMIY